MLRSVASCMATGILLFCSIMIVPASIRERGAGEERERKGSGFLPESTCLLSGRMQTGERQRDDGDSFLGGAQRIVYILLFHSFLIFFFSSKLTIHSAH